MRMLPPGLLSVLRALALLAVIGPTDLAAQQPACDADTSWKRVRQAYPIHAQVMAMCHAPGSGQFVVVFTEPPPHITRIKADAIVRALFQSTITAIERRRHLLGFDGWAEDLVITGRAATPQQLRTLSNDLGLLTYYAFGTTYKAEIEDIARLIPAPFFAAPASVEVRSSELDAWLFGASALLFVSAEGGPAAKLSEWAARDETGVFLSEPPGLVAAIVPRSRPLNGYRVDLRRFTVDTDAFLGAASLEKDHVALVGRERSSSFAEMPPLRVETLLLLAAVEAPQIAQSYERTRAFAGKLLSDARTLQGWDWAPILLSDELIDTEYGSLLNFTDNMLKSWSESGEVDYKGFPHDRPPRFPFVPGGALRRFGGNQLTYNWNTAGVGSLAESNRRLIFSVLKTGSLPVSYFPEGASTSPAAKAKLVSGEDQAYEYFSGLRSPMLARALQYAALYQAFQAFQIKATPPHERAAVQASMRTVEGVLKTQVLEAIAAFSRPDVPTTSELQTERAFFGQSPYAKEGLAEVRRLVASVIRDLDQSEGKEWRENFAAFLARGGGSTLSKDDKRGKQLRLVFDALAMVRLPETVRNTVLTAAAHDPSTWIRTPSIVVSRGAQQGRTGTGGHNIGGRVTRVEPDASVTRGEVWVSGNHEEGHVLRLHPDDAARSRDLVRLFDREVGFHSDNVAAATSALEARLHAGLPNLPPPRSVAVALNRPAARPGVATPRGAQTSSHAQPAGFVIERLPRAGDPLAAARSEPAVWITTRADNIYEFRLGKPPSPVVGRAANDASLREAVDLLSRSPPGVSEFYFLDRSAQESSNFVRSMQERMANAETAAGRGGGAPPGGKPPIEVLSMEGPERGHRFSGFAGKGTPPSGHSLGFFDRIPLPGRKAATVKASGRNAAEVMQSHPNWAKAELSFPDAAGLIHLEAPGIASHPHVTMIRVPREIVSAKPRWYEMRLFGWFREALTKETRAVIDSEVSAALKAAGNASMEDFMVSFKTLMLKHGSDKTFSKILGEASDVSVVELPRRSGSNRDG